MLVETTIDLYQKELQKTKFTLNDVWRLLNVAGEIFRKDRHLWTVNRFFSEGTPRYSTETSSIGIILSRTSRAARFDSKMIESIDELKTCLTPELCERLDNPKPLDRHLLAVAIQLSVCRHGKSYSYFYNTKNSCGFGNCAPNIQYVRYHYDRIEQGVWGKTFERTHSFRTLQEVYNHYEFMPFFDMHEVTPQAHLVQWRS
jgi:hypothetical protein